MKDLLSFGLVVFTGFFAIMNPIANVPIFSSLVEGADQATRRQISRRATGIAFLIVLVFVVLGRSIFELFGITIPAFKITGGILIFFVGFEMLRSQRSTVTHLQEPHLDENIAISPLAIPILAGPGTIVTAMNFVAKGGTEHIAIVIGVFAMMCVLTHAAFLLSGSIVKRLGNNVITVISKIMGLIIAIIGTSMVIDGIRTAFGMVGRATG
ncbi:MAG: MarC family protein [Flavobacteriales bacterium]|nr:MarC family protein [Flavobacteriales bacterium]MCB9168402.1 MarC family protein [Flavobacteriales bacterium]